MVLLDTSAWVLTANQNLRRHFGDRCDRKKSERAAEGSLSGELSGITASFPPNSGL